VLLGAPDDGEFQVGEELVVIGNQAQVDLDALLHSGISKTLGNAIAIGLVSDLLPNFGQVILAVGILDMSSELSAFAHQVDTASQQVAGGTHLSRIDIGLGEHATAQQCCNLLGIDRVVFGFAAVDGFHVEGVAQNEGNTLLDTEISEPVPREHTFDAQTTRSSR
jgi:hypothetical protein